MNHSLNYSIALMIFFGVCVYSNTQEECYIDDVTIGCPAYIIEGQFKALFLKPSTNNLYYAAEAFPFNNTIATPGVAPRWAIYDLHPDYHFGFDLGLRTTFPSQCTNLSIHWEHFKSCTSASHAAGTNNMMGPLSSIGPDAEEYKQARGQVKFNFNEVNITYGQAVDFGTHMHSNFFAGLSFARIKQCLSTFYAGADTVSRTTLVPSSFTGAGPQCGVDFSYTITNNFCFSGQLAAALLVGPAKNHTTWASTSPILANLGDPSPNLQSTCVENRHQMVPSFTEQLGFTYCRSFCESYLAKLEFGYQAKIFLNAIQSTDLSSGVIDVTPYDNTVGVFARTFARTLGNFALSGPYIGFDIAY